MQNALHVMQEDIALRKVYMHQTAFATLDSIVFKELSRLHLLTLSLEMCAQLGSTVCKDLNNPKTVLQDGTILHQASHPLLIVKNVLLANTAVVAIQYHLASQQEIV